MAEGSIVRVYTLHPPKKQRAIGLKEPVAIIYQTVALIGASLLWCNSNIAKSLFMAFERRCLGKNIYVYNTLFTPLLVRRLVRIIHSLAYPMVIFQLKRVNIYRAVAH